MRSLHRTIRAAHRRACRSLGLSAVMLGDILVELPKSYRPYLEECRSATLEITRVVGYTPDGDPLRALLSDAELEELDGTKGAPS